MATKKEVKTATKAPPKTATKVIRTTRPFVDRNGTYYQKGDVYQPISNERTEALMKAETSELNTIGEIFLTEGE